jgi:hypothetical protein
MQYIKNEASEPVNPKMDRIGRIRLLSTEKNLSKSESLMRGSAFSLCGISVDSTSELMNDNSMRQALLGKPGDVSWRISMMV